MGNIMTAFQNKTPLIITVGQQTREMAVCDPLLTNRDETMLPKPYVKWAYEPKRAQDVPRATMRAYALALQPPAEPVYVSISLDDWDQPALGVADVRTVSSRVGPDPDRLKEFAKRISASSPRGTRRDSIMNTATLGALAALSGSALGGITP